MKVKITYEECLYFKLEKEVEMTAKQYKEYLKNGASFKLQEELSSECCIDHFQEGETIAINFEKI
jgi:Zn/Cd-binding protein ZinT